MKCRVYVTSALLLIATSAQVLLACGDKYLVDSRNSRFSRPGARPVASILLYANPSSRFARTLASLPVGTTLKSAGYRTTAVSAPAALDQAMRQAPFDLVVADASDAGAVMALLQGPRAPQFLPVLYDPTNTEFAAAKRVYPSVLKSPTKTQSVLDAVDDAMEQRMKTLAKMPKGH